MSAQEEIFGPGVGPGDSTMLRILDELAGRLRADGLPGRRLARATTGARARAWAGIVARYGQLPAAKVAGKASTAAPSTRVLFVRRIIDAPLSHHTFRSDETPSYHS